MHTFPSPYSWLSYPAQQVIFIVLLVSTTALTVYLSCAQSRLQSVLKYGVVELETPTTEAHATTLVSSLKSQGLVEEARRQTLIDYVYLLLYPLALSLTCALLARGLDGKNHLIGTAISWGVLLACPFDACENWAMLKMLAGTTSAPWPMLATICASAKFTLTAGGIFFVIYGGIARLWQWLA
ncbi:hypothetical protein [Paraburkholderia sp. SIMBA_054]|uniref:hypothetical protein n=1 Tax=Paraburkholderia sp. SIMBA_054 TaxID=3085795 RepID=UPI00397E50C9